MKKRREAFVQEIRKKQKDEIKNCIRKKLLADDWQRDGAEGLRISTVLDSLPSIKRHHKHGELHENSSQHEVVEEFKEQMKKLMINCYENDGIEEWSCFGHQAVVALFSQKLKLIENQSHFQHLFDCYSLGLKLIGKYSIIVKTNNQNAIFPELTSTLQLWNHAFNIILLRAKAVDVVSSSSITSIQSSFNEWLSQIQSLLQLFWESEEQIDLVLHENLAYTLTELLQFCKFSLKTAKSEVMKSLIEQVISERMVLLLTFLLRSHRVDESSKIIVADLFLVMASGQMENIYNDILSYEYVQYIRFVVAYEQDYKIKDKSKPNALNQTILVNKMLQFIIDGSYLSFSDEFWTKGLCSELIAVEKYGIKDQNMRYNIITTLFVCVTNFKKESTIDLIQSSAGYDVFEWVLGVISEMIDTCYGDESIKEIISDGIQVIRFFFEIGEHYRQGASINPYRPKLQYTCGDVILSKSNEGLSFLQQIGWNVEQL